MNTATNNTAVNATQEVLLGRNLSIQGATALIEHVPSARGKRESIVVNGRELRIESARCEVPSGTYNVTRRDGRAPGNVDYFGHLAG